MIKINIQSHFGMNVNLAKPNKLMITVLVSFSCGYLECDDMIFVDI